MIKYGPRVLSLLTIVVGLFYGVGDYAGWWDQLSGRSTVTDVCREFTYNTGYPHIFVRTSDPRFSTVYSFLASRTRYRPVSDWYRAGKKPNAVCRLGFPFKPPGADNIPGWPDPSYCLPTTPVGFIYDPDSLSKDSRDSVYLVCTLGDIDGWITRSRDTERFWITVVILSLLATAVIWLEWRSADSPRT